MLYAKSRSCVHTYTKAIYDVHAVFSVHVCHSHMDRIICSLLCDCLFPLYFQVFLLVHTNSMHSLSALQLLGISLEYDIWHMVAWIFDISPNIHQVYLTYWWKFRHINIMRMVHRGIFVSLHSLLYDCTLMSTPFTAFILVHRVHIVLTLSHWFYVYETYTSGILRVQYTSLHTKRYIVYTTCIHPVLFSRLHIRPSHIYAFSNITFSYCASRLRMLACG